MRSILRGVIIGEPREVTDHGKDSKTGEPRTFKNVKVRINELPSELGQEVARWDIPAYRWRDEDAQRKVDKFFYQNEKVLAEGKHFVQFTVALTKSKNFDNSAMLSIVDAPVLVPAEGREIELIQMALNAEIKSAGDE